MKLVSVHVETSGLDADRGEILELSYQTWTDGTRNVVTNDRFLAVGNLNTPSFIEAAKLNGYDDAKAHQFATLRAGHMTRFLSALEGAEGLVACQPGLTIDFLREACRRFSVPWPRVRVFDVATLAIPLLMAEQVKGLKLADLVAGLTDKPAPKSSIDKVERCLDVFEKCIVRYYEALVAPAGGAK